MHSSVESSNNERKCYEMPKKLSVPRNNAQQPPKKGVTGKSSGFSNAAAVISEMHLQKGNNLVSQDFQRKIQNYQQILKKASCPERRQQ